MSEPDFRSNPSETNEGKGIARVAWDAYARAVNEKLGPTLHPLIQPAAAPVARTMVADLIGFWTLWHLHGGFEGMKKFGYSRATIYRKIKRFRQLFGVHPDEWEVVGIKLDPEAYWAEAERKKSEQTEPGDAAT
jgi:hypothetical protein